MALTKEDFIKIGDMLTDFFNPLNDRLNSMDKHLERVDQKLERVDQKTDALTAEAIEMHQEIRALQDDTTYIKEKMDERENDHKEEHNKIRSHIGLPKLPAQY